MKKLIYVLGILVMGIGLFSCEKGSGLEETNRLYNDQQNTSIECSECHGGNAVGSGKKG